MERLSQETYMKTFVSNKSVARYSDHKKFLSWALLPWLTMLIASHPPTHPILIQPCSLTLQMHSWLFYSVASRLSTAGWELDILLILPSLAVKSRFPHVFWGRQVVGSSTVDERIDPFLLSEWGFQSQSQGNQKESCVSPARHSAKLGQQQCVGVIL